MAKEHWIWSNYSNAQNDYFVEFNIHRFICTSPPEQHFHNPNSTILMTIYSSSAIIEDLKASLIEALSPAIPLPPAAPPIATPIPFPGQPIVKGGCPLCDRSVYSYCYDKMIHDACCCNNGKFQFKYGHHTFCVEFRCNPKWK